MPAISAAPVSYTHLCETAPPGCAGESKRAFDVSFERSKTVFNTQKMYHATGKNRLRGAGQAMQKTEHSVPPERLAGSMPFQGLRKPPALPGGLTHAQQSLSLIHISSSKPSGSRMPAISSRESCVPSRRLTA